MRQTLCDGNLRCMGMRRGVSFTSRLLVLGILTVAAFLVSSGSGNGSPVAHAQVYSTTGTTYYVAPGGSDTAPGTEEEPFATIQRTFRTAR